MLKVRPGLAHVNNNT